MSPRTPRSNGPDQTNGGMEGSRAPGSEDRMTGELPDELPDEMEEGFVDLRARLDELIDQVEQLVRSRPAAALLLAAAAGYLVGRMLRS